MHPTVPAPPPTPPILIARRRRCLCLMDIAIPQDDVQRDRVVWRWKQMTASGSPGRRADSYGYLVEEWSLDRVMLLTRADFGCLHIGAREARGPRAGFAAKEEDEGPSTEASGT